MGLEWKNGSSGRTGMGSYIVVGCHSLTSLISDTISCARVGEHMKCRVDGVGNLVPCRSRGVRRLRGLR
jgi:hypothetical protein